MENVIKSKKGISEIIVRFEKLDLATKGNYKNQINVLKTLVKSVIDDKYNTVYRDYLHSIEDRILDLIDLLEADNKKGALRSLYAIYRLFEKVDYEIGIGSCGFSICV